MRVHPGRPILLCTFLAAASAAAGCGGGGSEDSTPPPTKAAFIKRADAICEKTDTTQKAAFKVFSQKNPNAAGRSGEEEVVVVVGLPPVRTEVKELAALPTPGGDEEKIAAILRGIEEAVKEGEAEPSTMLKKGSSGPFAPVERLAREYGFKACAFPL
jgi:hypothetical protein